MDRFEKLSKKLEILNFADLEGDEQLACLRERDHQIRQLKRMQNHLGALEDPKASGVFIRALAEARTHPTGMRPPEENSYSEWSLKIERVSNGFIISHEAQEPGCEGMKHVELFEEGRDSSIEVKLGGQIPEAKDVAMYNVLYYVMEHFGIVHSKHKKINLMIRFEFGED
jgi:hypothetical protein